MKRNRLLYIIYLTYSILLLNSCSMGDVNGDLDGMWQLTEWRDKATNDVVKTNQDSIYYCFQQKLLKFQKLGIGNHYLSHFTHTGDSLFIGAPVFWPAEEVRSMNELAKYGIPANGHLHIDVLNNDRMVLSSPQSTISFRKY